MGAYDTPAGCTGGPAPGATALLERGLQNFPGVTSGGIYSCRRTRTGSGWSEHAEGRAIDFMVRDRGLGDRLANWAIRIPGVQSVIWHDRIWTSTSPTWRPYPSSGTPYADPTLGHRDHVHVGLTRAAAGSPSTGSGVRPIQGIAGGIGNGVAGLGGDIVEAAVAPLLDGLLKVLVIAAVAGLGVTLVVAGGYRTVTGRRISGDAKQAGATAAELYVTKGASKGTAAAMTKG